jgi:hypothetical protein
MKNTDTASLIRQKYLESAVLELRAHFTKLGYTVPANVRISVGFPKGTHKGAGGKTIGQCWPYQSSTDKHSEIFISPELRDTETVVHVIAHELVHATVGCEAGHKAPFKCCALAIGLTGKMTATVAGEGMKAFIKRFVQAHGEYPAGALMVANRKKQGTRLLKCACEECGYTVRTTRQWVEGLGTPICPKDKVSMSCDAIDGEDS